MPLSLVCTENASSSNTGTFTSFPEMLCSEIRRSLCTDRWDAGNIWLFDSFSIQRLPEQTNTCPKTSGCYYYNVAHFKFALALCQGIVVSVRPAGWDNIVSRKRTSAGPIRARMVAPVWTVTTATPVSVNLDSEVRMFVAIF